MSKIQRKDANILLPITNLRFFTTETTESTEAASPREIRQYEFLSPFCCTDRATPQRRRTFFKKAKDADLKNYLSAFLKNVLLLWGVLRKKGDLCSGEAASVLSVVSVVKFRDAYKEASSTFVLNLDLRACT